MSTKGVGCVKCPNTKCQLVNYLLTTSCVRRLGVRLDSECLAHLLSSSESSVHVEVYFHQILLEDSSSFLAKLPVLTPNVIFKL